MGNTPTPATTILGRGGGGGVKKLSLGAEMLSVDQFQASPSCLALITEPLNDYRLHNGSYAESRARRFSREDATALPFL